MELSIIIVNYNTKDLLLACIDSILKSSPKVEYEIIIVDNASIDGSVEVLHKIRGGKIRVILHKKNLGFAKANNSGIKKAVGQYILLLNSDTELTRGALDSLINFAKHTPLVGLVGPKLLNTDGSLQGSVYRFPTLKRAIRQYWLGKGKPLDKYAPIVPKAVVVEAIVAAAMLITPRGRHGVGLLDERYFMYFEDLEYCRQIWKAGLKVYYLPEAIVYHHHGASGKTLATDKDQWRRLIPSSKIYHGIVNHYLINFVLWSGQKWQRLLGKH